MDRIRGHVERQLGRFDGQGSMPRIVAAWPGVVGAEVARNAWPARVARDGTLHVHASSSVWAFELGQLAPRILGQLAAELGEHAPKTLRFVQGHLPEAEAGTRDAVRRETPAPSAEALAEAASLTAPIADQELRERVARAAALSLSRGLSRGLAGPPDGRSF
jgi:hypothetical protein